ncbi:MAG: DUF4395 domain-containing protein [Acidimicrobiia bacterium]|nr:DUF4395 domain-containing protein [Acidimicrobiia bacterium]
MRRPFDFPNPVNEVAARTVAAGVVAMSVTYLLTRHPLVLAPLSYGFAARVASGPRFSPLGLLATRLVAPAIAAPRLVPGPPKRFAQGIGATLSILAVVAHAAGAGAVAVAAVGAIAVAASLEAALGFCLGCRGFAILMRLGVIPEHVCVECNDIWSGRRLPADRTSSTSA